MGELNGRNVLITGAARRIGRSIAVSLARAGVNVVLHFRDSRDEAEALATEVRTYGVRCVTLRADLAEESESVALLTRAEEAVGPISLLVNNASIFDGETLDEAGWAAFRRNLDVNALSPFVITRELARRARAHISGAAEPHAPSVPRAATVNLLDARITDYDRGHVPYAVSKRALHTLTRMCAVEFAPEVRVNAVAPGLILPPPGADEAYLERYRGTNPLHDHGSAADVAKAVLFLLESEFVTGQILYVDGGRHLRGNMYGL